MSNETLTQRMQDASNMPSFGRAVPVEHAVRIALEYAEELSAERNGAEAALAAVTKERDILRSELHLANRSLIVGEFGDALNRADKAERERDAALELLRDVVPTVADARRGAIASWLDGDWWRSRDALLNGPSAGAGERDAFDAALAREKAAHCEAVRRETEAERERDAALSEAERLRLDIQGVLGMHVRRLSHHILHGGQLSAWDPDGVTRALEGVLNRADAARTNGPSAGAGEASK